MHKFFSTTLGHILIVISCSTLITFTVLCIWLFIPKGPPGPPWPWQTTYRIGSLVKILRATDAPERNSLQLVAQHTDGLQFSWEQAPHRCHLQTFNTWDLTRTLSYELAGKNKVEVYACNHKDPRKNIQVIVRIGDTHLVAYVASIDREPTRFTFPTLCAILFLLTGIAVMSMWAIGRIISPLRALSENAEEFSRNMTVVTIKEEGPVEIRQVAHTLNIMQERITSYMQSRTHMLAAISHDLRTPLTRMRLSLETHSAETAKQKILRDIDLMNKLISSALSFIRTGSDGENAERVDLDALITTICDEYEDGGLVVSCSGPSPLPLLCKPEAIQRVITNLIENAAAHAKKIYINSQENEYHIVIDVVDDGPGIPDDMLNKVKEPFFHMNHARNERNGHAGLGLSIVNEIIKSHGGKFELINRTPVGLIARITLPKSENARCLRKHSGTLKD